MKTRIVIDAPRRILTVGKREVRLTHKEFELAIVLSSSNGAVVTRREFLQKIWRVKDASEIATRTVDQHMSRLRRKLGAAGARIRTVPKIGYQLL